MEDKGFYAMAVDGHGKPCRVKGSNPGHLLFCGLPTPERAKKVADTLLSAAFHNGFGVRTLAQGEPRFNPMSYHNGSVWPHDTAICAMGLARYGQRDGVVSMTSGLFETAAHYGMRLPELFCGFPRQPGEPPVAYPVACLPQAWAAGSAFMMLQACLGITVDGWNREVNLSDPRLPIGIDHLQIDGLVIGGLSTDITFENIGAHVAAHASKQSKLPILIRR
jgi:glycogen debranching enzyme